MLFGSTTVALSIQGHAQYIIPLALQALPAVVLFVGMIFANKFPRFLAMKTPEKALVVFSKLRNLPIDHPYVRDEMENILLQLEEEWSFTPNNSIFTLMKEALTSQDIQECRSICTPVGLFATRIYGIVKLVAYFIFIMFVTDSLGRRKSLLWTGIVQVSYFDALEGNILIIARELHSSTSVSSFILIPQLKGPIPLHAIYIFAAVYQFGWGPVVWIYCTASQWLFNFVVAKATPSMFATLGKNGFGMYFVYGSSCFTMVVFT
ncbi:hypothetical protein N7492_010400 [Penicillium capsulatum]|uniref:Major facilitator superfamily (MFS) profile domain-containing protein n=1 Tax=Penicillium capsulatum TaxID=69766 RepID=A0A9W9LFE7_9EURO|nr:hypothetical protein N7492_010400 [Penicillium capsulatum]KAJ6112904.1 hypothetical protein N7512_008228 [Penicillium capsulatum]